jgi:hypothetical protein
LAVQILAKLLSQRQPHAEPHQVRQIICGAVLS